MATMNLHKGKVAIGTIGELTSSGNIAAQLDATVPLTNHREYSWVGTLADYESTNLPAGYNGWAFVVVGNNVAYALFRFRADGSVTLVWNSANVSTAISTDAKVNIAMLSASPYNFVKIENMLGSTYKVQVKAWLYLQAISS